ncbi:hypothetical protein Alg130_11748 [Pyrenophora tritici-repentis]|nr:hypothetical protein Alg215_11836 [Pyrenophora tritici-repentis]KAI0569200.1 hypothetical protein Alg130_11748 [Pyrenophora tritici-repentis]KAI0604013.1 hypothetical protein TUN205_11740 [Pyrenophora tritici-repentis]
MEIPKVYSAPADPTAPSLLKLPAEVRNTISRFVFVQPEPILIHNADFYYNQKPVVLDARGNDYIRNEKER